jgi:hypothetical protein
MKFIFEVYNKRLSTSRAIVGKMLTSAVDANVVIPPEIVRDANDFLEMYTKYREKVVGSEKDPSSQIYNGDINTDVYKGKNGNTVVGLHSLLSFGKKIESRISKSVTEKK